MRCTVLKILCGAEDRIFNSLIMVMGLEKISLELHPQLNFPMGGRSIPCNHAQMSWISYIMLYSFEVSAADDFIQNGH